MENTVQDAQFEAVEPERVEVTTFEELLDTITLENAENFLTDLTKYLYFYAEMIDKVRQKHPVETEGLTNTQIAKSSFVWIDDGKNDFKFITVTDQETGEVTRIESPFSDTPSGS